jgi:hypothetical protein
MDSKKTPKAKASAKAKDKGAKKTPAQLEATVLAGGAVKLTAKTSKNNEDAAAGNFLFSIPSLHTEDHDYEHLVVAPTKEEACRLLAEARVTEKQPELTGEHRSALVAYATKGYCSRNVEQIEPRMEVPGVLAINHHKVGIASPSVH